jgi:signal transduction histidine kinase
MSQLRESIWAVNTDTITLIDIILRLNAFGNKMSEEFDIEYCYEGNMPPEQRIHPNTGLHVYRILQEAINNAFKHSNAKRIELSFVPLQTFVVTDNGVGIASKETESYGLKNMAARAEEINAKFEIIALSNGTQVRLQLQ